VQSNSLAFILSFSTFTRKNLKQIISKYFYEVSLDSLAMVVVVFCRVQRRVLGQRLQSLDGSQALIKTTLKRIQSRGKPRKGGHTDCSELKDTALEPCLRLRFIR
jgi:hypothetical protein